MRNPINELKSCTNCELCMNQLPLVHNVSECDVFWLGLSAVRSIPNDVPLSATTNSGKLIKEIESFLPLVDFYHTNLVKCLPLLNEKIRYPNTMEMKACYFNLLDEIDYFQPKIIFLLGKQVSNFVLNQFGNTNLSISPTYDYESYKFDNTLLVPVHHPSFILVYKRKNINDYIHGITSIINKVMEKSAQPCADVKSRKTISLSEIEA